MLLDGNQLKLAVGTEELTDEIGSEIGSAAMR